MIIAIDGPAGTGKSTIAKLISEKLGITFLNSGSFYRGITLALLRGNIDMNNQEEILAVAESINMDYIDSKLFLDSENVENFLHSDEVDMYVSQVSSITPLRHIVNKKLRLITEKISVVCEGRDITTVVFPNAQYKFYLDASIDVQAERRFKQGVSDLSLEEIKESIKKRDEADKNKKEGSLKIAEDAIYIDTSDLTIDKVCEIIISKIHV